MSQNYGTIIEDNEEDTFYRHVHFLFKKKKKNGIKKIYTKT